MTLSPKARREFMPLKNKQGVAPRIWLARLKMVNALPAWYDDEGKWWVNDRGICVISHPESVPYYWNGSAWVPLREPVA